jgi:hypothetical protein
VPFVCQRGVWLEREYVGRLGGIEFVDVHTVVSADVDETIEIRPQAMKKLELAVGEGSPFSNPLIYAQSRSSARRRQRSAILIATPR